MIELIYLDRDMAVIFKPEGIPSQADPSGDSDAMTLTSALLAERGEPDSLWLIHRLDRTVAGLLVFARNKAAAAELSSAVAGDGMRKKYLAVTDGVAPSGTLSDLLFHDKRAAKAFVVDRERRGVKAAELISSPIISAEAVGKTYTLIEVELKTGRFHQIRAQMSNHGAPLVGDGKYGSRDKGRRTPALFAYSLEFEYKKRTNRFVRLPDNQEYPWSLFGEEVYKELQ